MAGVDRDPARPGRQRAARADLIDLRDPALPAHTVIAALGLAPHPEGGHFRETWRDTPAGGGRGVGTAILFLLARDEVSHWHRVDAAECWIFQAGAPLVLSVSPDGRDAAGHVLGPDLAARQTLQHVVPVGHWQAANSLGAWSLVSCVVAPAFQFAGFELAPPDWRPTGMPPTDMSPTGTPPTGTPPTGTPGV